MHSSGSVGVANWWRCRRVGRFSVCVFGIPCFSPTAYGRGGKARTDLPPPRWLATHPGKRWTEFFFLGYSPLWIGAMCAIVVSKAYEVSGPNGHTITTACPTRPCPPGPVTAAVSLANVIVPGIRGLVVHVRRAGHVAALLFRAVVVPWPGTRVSSSCVVIARRCCAAGFTRPVC